MGYNYTVKIDAEKARKFVVEKTTKGLVSFMEEVKERVTDYIPEDTESLKKQTYIYLGKEMIIVGVGSKTGDDKINKVAVYQHENTLNHFGSPKGKSMREGVEGADIPGMPWAIDGKSRKNNILTRQNNMYQKGYRDKKKRGVLTKYKAEFLKKAVKEVLAHWKKHFTKK